MAEIIFEFKCPNRDEIGCDGQLIDAANPDPKRYKYSLICDKCGCRMNIGKALGPFMATDDYGNKCAQFSWYIGIKKPVGSIDLEFITKPQREVDSIRVRRFPYENRYLIVNVEIDPRDPENKLVHVAVNGYALVKPHVKAELKTIVEQSARGEIPIDEIQLNFDAIIERAERERAAIPFATRRRGFVSLEGITRIDDDAPTIKTVVETIGGGKPKKSWFKRFLKRDERKGIDR